MANNLQHALQTLLESSCGRASLSAVGLISVTSLYLGVGAPGLRRIGGFTGLVNLPDADVPVLNVPVMKPTKVSGLAEANATSGH